MRPNQQLSKRQLEQLEELQSKMQGEIQHMIITEKLPAAVIHASFADWLTLALPHETTVTMNTGYPDYKKLWKAMKSKPVIEYNL